MADADISQSKPDGDRKSDRRMSRWSPTVLIAIIVPATALITAVIDPITRIQQSQAAADADELRAVLERQASVFASASNKDVEMVKLMLQDVLAVEDQDKLMQEWAFAVLEQHSGVTVPRETVRNDTERPEYRPPEPVSANPLGERRASVTPDDAARIAFAMIKTGASRVLLINQGVDEDLLEVSSSSDTLSSTLIDPTTEPINQPPGPNSVSVPTVADVSRILQDGFRIRTNSAKILEAYIQQCVDSRASVIIIDADFRGYALLAFRTNESPSKSFRTARGVDRLLERITRESSTRSSNPGQR